jgi:hypothetical protein
MGIVVIDKKDSRITDADISAGIFDIVFDVTSTPMASLNNQPSPSGRSLNAHLPQ